MSYTYQLKNDSISGKLSNILRSDNVWIPIDPFNTDYQEYLKWLEAGNTPEAAS